MLRHLLTGAAALVLATSASAETYAIQAGRLIVDAAQPERGPSTVIVEKGRIRRIENRFSAPAGAILLDEPDRTIMPGMTAAHAYLADSSGEPVYPSYTRTGRSPL